MPKIVNGYDGLSFKEKMYADGILEGKTQYQSFMDAYNPKTENRQSIDSMANHVKNRERVKNYLEKVKQRVELRQKYGLSMSIEDRKELIYERIDACMEKGDDAAVARYMDLLNKMEQSYVNITKNIDEKDNNISALSTDELKKLINSSTDT